ncbi:class I ribonucleotide reductase maintenance protein YfaE [Thalassolituus sp.]|uniref:class I ribonucleotide reductase maintenance protein YfaE n=1 Tax=Thalassolituus sp. TaxID=2030822 RepID=UPI0039C4AEE8
MPSPRKAPRLGRRRWGKAKTFHSTAQTELDLPEGQGSSSQIELDLLLPPILVKRSADEPAPIQGELLLPEFQGETPEPTPQIEFEGMQKPIFDIILEDGRQARFQHAHTLLESLESQDIEVHYQCREGYCGSCRTQLLEGDVHYLEEPMAWIDDDEILPCCCIPKSALRIKLQ